MRSGRYKQREDRKWIERDRDIDRDWERGERRQRRSKIELARSAGQDSAPSGFLDQRCKTSEAETLMCLV